MISENNIDTKLYNAINQLSYSQLQKLLFTISFTNIYYNIIIPNGASELWYKNFEEISTNFADSYGDSELSLDYSSFKDLQWKNLCKYVSNDRKPFLLSLVEDVHANKSIFELHNKIECEVENLYVNDFAQDTWIGDTTENEVSPSPISVEDDWDFDWDCITAALEACPPDSINDGDIVNVTSTPCINPETGETAELINVEVIPNEDNNLDFEAF